MTKEQIDKYKQIFILCLEVAGEETGDPFLRNIESILDGSESVFEEYLRFTKRPTNDMSIGELITTLLVISILTYKMNKGGLSLIDEDLNMERMVNMLSTLTDDIMLDAATYYKDYLKAATEKFCKDNNLDLSTIGY